MSINSILSKLENIEAKIKNSSEAVERLVEMGAEIVDAKFQSAMADYVGERDATVTGTVNGNKGAIVASGSDVAFLEFGAGVTHNSNPYTYDIFPQPVGIVGIGEYGQGHGKNKAWKVSTRGRNIQGGDVVRNKKTRKIDPNHVWSTGNAPARAMYEADKKIREEAAKVISEAMK